MGGEIEKRVDRGKGRGVFGGSRRKRGKGVFGIGKGVFGMVKGERGWKDDVVVGVNGREIKEAGENKK